jgi:hypothetical protein
MKFHAAAILFSLALPSAAMAADVPPEVRAACKADFMTLCKGVIPGGGRPLACFIKNAGALSPKCKATLSKASCSADAPANLKAAFPCAG